MIHQPLIERSREEWNRPAILWNGGRLTHGDLRARALSFARTLRKTGVAAGDRVAIVLPKSPEAVVAIFGTLVAGAVYVPVHATDPLPRIMTILADAEPAVVVTARGSNILRQPEAGHAHRFVILDEPDLLPGPDSVDDFAEHGLHAVADEDRPAAILYTSGSTGTPKGIVLSHRNIGSFVQWAITRFGLTRDDRFCSHARFHFDLSTLDLFAPIALGASVYVVDEAALLFPARITQIVEREALTVWYATPSALRLVVRHGALDRRNVSSLRWIFFAGEVFPIPALRELMLQLRGPRYANLYGPTETNVCTYWIVEAAPEDDEAPVPIGLARDDLQVGIFDEAGLPLQVDETGEICVAGPAVMLGYWKRPDLTAASRLGGRSDTYRTGDYGWKDAHGVLHYAGRRDHQVKVQGHRLELMEIEQHLATHADVSSAAVSAIGEAGDVSLVAFVSLRANGERDLEALRRHCARALPPWAVPGRFVVLPELPLTSTGKVDRQRLTTLVPHESMQRLGEGSGHG